MTRRFLSSACAAIAFVPAMVAACGNGSEPDRPSGASGARGGGAGTGNSSVGGSSHAGASPTAGSGAASGGSGPSAGGSNGTGGSSNPGGGAGQSATGGGAPTAGSGVGAGNGGAAGASTAAGGSAGSAVASGGMGGDFGSGSITLSGLKIDANPNMTISCFVSWTTTEAASSEVDFGESDYTFRIRDAAAVTDHQVLVIGMHASTMYKIKAFSGNATGTGSLEGTFTTGKLPSGLPTPKLNVDDIPADQKGWLLTNIQGSNSPALAVMYDEKGLPVWYFVHGTQADQRGDVTTELLASNTVLVGPTNGQPGREVDLSGKVLWEGPANGTTELMSHYLGKTSTGNYLLNYELDKAVTNGSTKIDDQRLEEVTPKNEVVWSWKLFDHIKPAGNREELCHGNMLVLDEKNDILYYNCRFLGLFKIDRKSGDILWRIGGTYDSTSLGPGDFTFSPTASQYSDTHEPEFHADGTILFYDNGGYAGLGGGSTTQYHSRIVEYKMDETAKTMTRTFEFPGDFSGVDTWYKNTWYSPYWGDADNLPDGNILVTAPVRSASASTRFFEVSRDGKIVWELELPANNGSFKAQRLLPPPLVEKLQ
ncbi:MAG TPA: aryl-sulfate sulfotransferase [Polyangiaceae bacterium]|nr:aryl-sulfate sulfotransferase [Polyangiaceae bacterium]